jgi:uncharacterized protein YaaQ
MPEEKMRANPIPVDQLAVVTAFESQVNPLMARLTGAGFYVTQINTSGGLLYDARISLMIGLNQTRLTDLLAHIRACCGTEVHFVPAYGETLAIEAQPMLFEAEVGGATIFVLDVEHFVQF